MMTALSSTAVETKEPNHTVFLAANSKNSVGQAAVAPSSPLVQKWWEQPHGGTALVAVVWRSTGKHALLLQMGEEDEGEGTNVLPSLSASYATNADFHPEFEHILLVATKQGFVLLFQLQGGSGGVPGSSGDILTSVAPHLSLSLSCCEYGAPSRVAWTTLNATSFFTFHDAGIVFVWNLVLLQAAVAKRNGRACLKGSPALLARCAKKFRLLNPSLPQFSSVEVLLCSHTDNPAKKMTFLVCCESRLFLTDALKHGTVLCEWPNKEDDGNNSSSALSRVSCDLDQVVGLQWEDQRSIAILSKDKRLVTVVDIDWERSQIGQRWKTEIELDKGPEGIPKRVTLLGNPDYPSALMLTDDGPESALLCRKLTIAANGRVSVQKCNVPFKQLSSHRSVALLPSLLLYADEEDKSELSLVQTIREIKLRDTGGAVWVDPRTSGAASTSASTPRVPERRTSVTSISGASSLEDNGKVAAEVFGYSHVSKSFDAIQAAVLSLHKETCASAISRLSKEMNAVSGTLDQLVSSVGQLQMQVATILQAQSLLTSALLDNPTTTNPTAARCPPDRTALEEQFWEGLQHARQGRKGWEGPWAAALAHDCLEGTPASDRRALRLLCLELRAPEAMGNDWLKLNNRQLLSSAGVLAACLLEHSDWTGEEEIEVVSNWICELALASKRDSTCDVPLGTRLVLVETLKACQAWARSHGFETTRRRLEIARNVIEAL